MPKESTKVEFTTPNTFFIIKRDMRSLRREAEQKAKVILSQELVSRMGISEYEAYVLITCSDFTRSKNKYSVYNELISSITT